ncbi:MAG: PF20097 family protein [Oscillospiraceae bacterium]
MNCPKCGKEMRKGFLSAKKPIHFTENPGKMTIFKGKGDVTVSGILDYDDPEAWLCEDCRRVIVAY